MTQYHPARDFRVLQDGVDCRGEVVHCVCELRFITLAVSRQVERYHSATFCEIRNLITPGCQIGTPPVYQNKRIASLTVTLIVNLRAIVRGKLRFTVFCQGHRHGHQQQQRHKHSQCQFTCLHMCLQFVFLTMTSVMSSVRGRGAAKSFIVPRTETSIYSTEPPCLHRTSASRR